MINSSQIKFSLLLLFTVKTAGLTDFRSIHILKKLIFHDFRYFFQILKVTGSIFNLFFKYFFPAVVPSRKKIILKKSIKN
jgi:hypothetical protein